MSVIAKPIYSFTTGEVSPAFYGRPDIQRYNHGAKLLHNFFVDYRGGAVSRPGMKYIGPLIDGTAGVRMFRFKAVNDDYLLIFTHETLRIIRQGGYLLEASGFSISDIDTSGTVTATGHSFTDGDLIYISGVLGMTEVNGRYFKVSNATTNTFDLTDYDGTSIVDTSVYSAYTSGGTATATVTISTPYAGADLENIQCEQRYATMVITSLDYAPRRLTYVSDTSWVLSTISFGAVISPPGSITLTASGSGSAGVAFVVTSVDENGNESVASSYAIKTNSVDYSATAGSMKVTWGAVTDAVAYNVYRSLILPIGTDCTSAQSVGYVGTAFGEIFTDTNITPDFTKTPPLAFNPFSGGNNPRLFKVFQQRGVYAGSEVSPMTIWGSRPGNLDDFDISYVVNDGDAYIFTLDTSDVQPILHMLSIRAGLLLFTGVGVTLLRAQEGRAITPLNALAEPQAYRGASSAPPIPIDLDVVFVQAQSTAVNAMMYTEYTNTFKLQDVSVLSSHLLGKGKRLRRLEWMASPHKLMYCLREDGQLLTVTYERENEVFGWGQHSTRGRFKEICSVLENGQDTLYTVVERYIDGSWRQYVEVLQDRVHDYTEDFWCVDAGLTYPLESPAADLSFSAADGSGIVVTASASIFSAGNVGDVIYAGGGKLVIDTYTSATEVECTALRKISNVVPQGGGIPYDALSGAWQMGTPTTSVTNLWHLEGETVSILADGDAYINATVTNGSVEIPAASTKITVGIPYNCDLELLPIAFAEEAVEHRRKDILGVGTRMRQTRGLEVGGDFDNLVEIKNPSPEYWGNDIPLQDEVIYTTVNTGWSEDRTLCYRQRYPLPATVLSSIISFDLRD